MRKPFWMRTVGTLTAVLLTLPLPAMARSADYPSREQSAQPEKQFSQEELAQLVAPIALYPDELVAQILMAATYPLEIVEADRWVQQNKDLQGDTLARALEEKSWDPSVKSLVNFPSLLSMMSRKLEVTAKLGDAFLTQEKEVMDTVQTLRKKAYAAGNLTATREQKVLVDNDTVIIEPTNPRIIYLPTYNPTIVYGEWMYPAYPPYPYYAYPPPTYGAFAFAAGITVGLAWGYAWGGCNWHGGSVNFNIRRNTTINNTYINRNNYQRSYQTRGLVGPNGDGRWRHDPTHRKGVAYRHTETARKYGQSPPRASQPGRDARGYGVNYPVPPPRESKGTNGKSGGGGNLAPAGGGRMDAGKGSPPSGVRESAFGRSYGDSGSSRADSVRGRASRQNSGGGPGQGSSGGFSGGGRDGGGGHGGGSFRR